MALAAHGRAGGRDRAAGRRGDGHRLSGRYEQILNYVVSVDFIAFGLTAAALFVFRRGSGAAPDGVYRAPGHPYTTALFVLACAGIVASTVATDPAEQRDRGCGSC